MSFHFCIDFGLIAFEIINMKDICLWQKPTGIIWKKKPVYSLFWQVTIPASVHMPKPSAAVEPLACV